MHSLFLFRKSTRHMLFGQDHLLIEWIPQPAQAEKQQQGLRLLGVEHLSVPV